MNKIFSSPQSAEVELVKNMLADAGILCEVRNGDFSQIVPAPPFYEELWIQDDDLPRASELLSAWQGPQTMPPPGTWICPECGEVVEGQFTTCWKCGAPRPLKTEDGRV
jgi:hypothetical protein